MAFTAVSSFRVSMLDNTYGGSQRVVVQIGEGEGAWTCHAVATRAAQHATTRHTGLDTLLPGLETGLKIVEADGNKPATLRSLQLAHITR